MKIPVKILSHLSKIIHQVMYKDFNGLQRKLLALTIKKYNLLRSNLHWFHTKDTASFRFLTTRGPS